MDCYIIEDNILGKNEFLVIDSGNPCTTMVTVLDSRPDRPIIPPEKKFRLGATTKSGDTTGRSRERWRGEELVGYGNGAKYLKRTRFGSGVVEPLRRRACRTSEERRLSPATEYHDSKG